MMLDALLMARLEQLVGARLIATRPVGGGYTPALRLVGATTTASYFIKVGVTPLTAAFLRREISVYARLRGSFMPRVIGWSDDENPPVLVLEDLSSWRWPPPWDARAVDAALAQIEALHATPCDLEPYAEVYRERTPNWRAVAADPRPFLSLDVADEAWLATALPLLLAYEERCSTAGESLCHWDLRSDNMAIAGDRVVLVDWNLACCSNARLDLGFWLPSLQFEGGPAPEAILPDAPEVAAWVAGFFAARAGLPGVPDAPRVRLVQRQQLAMALPWAIRALELPPLVTEAR
jgi:hypothetical protein